MMNSISRLMAFSIVVAAISAANSAHAQPVAAEAGTPAACMNRAAPPSPQAAMEGDKENARRADSKVEETQALEISKDGLLRRTSVSVEQTESERQHPGQRVEEALSSRPQACYPPAPARKAVDR